MLLTEEQIQEWINDRFGVPNTVNVQSYIDFSKFAVGTMVVWGNEICTCKGEYMLFTRHQCEECWKKLEDSVK